MTASPLKPMLAGDVLVTPRPFFDYQRMFGITAGDLNAGTILDCPSGASPFAAQVRLRGGSAVSVDPIYQLSLDEILNLVQTTLNRAPSWLEAEHPQVNRSFFGSPDALARGYQAAADLFTLDYQVNPSAYVNAGLPNLPFEDDEFALTVSSHLLFTDPQDFVIKSEVDAICEMCRVTIGEVRIHPIVDARGQSVDAVGETRAQLEAASISTEIRETGPVSIVGGNKTLVCTKR